ncbi:MAG: acyl--CoA ligase [Calditrichaeota bacterium]|nr:acyl--CoA ligase [Calditrichota bacterium]MCB9366481.1 acyl--CoA ligase [Calditrichota bacterium]MCB9391261.1 acyl--CoA ligase [Calditrichota bacterium]
MSTSLGFESFDASKWAADQIASVRNRTVLVADGREISGDELAKSCEVWRSSLLAARIEPGAVVAIAAERSPDAVALFLSCLQCGALPFFVDPRQDQNDLYKLLDAVRIQGIWCGTTLDREGIAARLPYLRWKGECEGQGGTLDSTTPSVEQASAFVLHSAGTCSLPRALFHSGAAIAWQAKALISQLRLRASLEVWFTGTLASPAVLSLGVFTVLSCGGTLVLDEPDSHLASASTSPGQRILILAEAKDEQSWNAENLLKIKGRVNAVLHTDARLSEEFHERLSRATDASVWTGSYAAETAGFYALNTLPGVWPFESAGRPIGGASFRIFGTDGRPVLCNEIGRLAVSGTPQPQKTVSLSFKSTVAKSAEDSWWWVGDWARMDAHDFLHLEGCEGAVFEKGGFTVVSSEIEDALIRIEGIADAVAFAQPDEDLDCEVSACIVPSDGMIDAQQIPLKLLGALVRFKIPRTLSIEPNGLLRTPSGKLVRHGSNLAANQVSQLKPLPEVKTPVSGPKVASKSEADSVDESLPAEDL